MGKVITIPTGSNYSLPANAPGTYVNLGGGQYDVTNIDIASVRTLLGISANDLAAICTSGNININALFRPNKQTPYNLGDFAGYNHQANPATYYYGGKTTSFSVNKASNYSFGFAVNLMRGERLPLDNSFASYWNFVRVKAVVSDTLNNRSFTMYSPVQAVAQGTNTVFNLSYTDSIRNDISGTATLTAEYTDSAGSVVYGSIEDTYPTITLNVTGYYTILGLSGFNYNPWADGDVRLYYYNGSTLTYQSLSQATSGAPKIILGALHSMGSTIHGIYYTSTVPSGDTIPATLGGTYSLVWVVFAYNGSYYKYSPSNNYTTGQIFDTEYKVGSDVSKIYKLTYLGVSEGWPTTYS